MLKADIAALFNVDAATISVSKRSDEVVFVTLKVDEEQYQELKALHWNPYPMGMCETGRNIQFRGLHAVKFLCWLMPHLRAAKERAEHAICSYYKATSGAKEYQKLRHDLARCIPQVQLAGC